MTTQELEWAQLSIYKGSKHIGEAGMRLQGTKYEKEFERIWCALSKLNSRLINDINK